MDLAMKEFVAYSRKLLRELMEVRKALDENNIERAKVLVDALIEDSQRDIEA